MKMNMTWTLSLTQRTRIIKQTPIWPPHITHIIIVIAFQFLINNEPKPSVTPLQDQRRGISWHRWSRHLPHKRFMLMCCSLMLQSCRPVIRRNTKWAVSQDNIPIQLTTLLLLALIRHSTLTAHKAKVSANILNRRIITTCPASTYRWTISAYWLIRSRLNTHFSIISL